MEFRDQIQDLQQVWTLKINFFHRIFTEDLYIHIANQTNEYAQMLTVDSSQPSEEKLSLSVNVRFYHTLPGVRLEPAIQCRGAHGLVLSFCKAFLTSCKIQPTLNFQRKALPTVIPCTNYSVAACKTASSQSKKILQPCIPYVQTVRTKMTYDWYTIRCNKTEGKPEANEEVLRRFKRLNSGLWIRTKAGRHKNLWKKNAQHKYRLRQHVFCNTQQSNLLDKMVTAEWKRKTFFVDDPYEPYQKRTNMQHLGFDIEKPKFIP